MIISDMITEIGNRVDRSDIDAKIRRHIQDAVEEVYNLREWSFLNRTYAITTVASTQSYVLSADHGEIINAAYVSGSSSGHKINVITEVEADSMFAGSTDTGTPYYAWLAYESGIYKIFFFKIPSDAKTINIKYKLGLLNTYLHNLNISDNDAAASSGVAIYLDEDAIATGIGKLYFVSPTTTDARVSLQTADGHYHELIIYHSADAATLGKAVYFDDDYGTARERLRFVSPTGADCAVPTEIRKGHSHFIKFVDDDAAATGPSSQNSQVYCDEDAAAKEDRLLSVNNGNADVVQECIITKDDDAHPFLRTFDRVIRLHALSTTQDWIQEFKAAEITMTKFTSSIGRLFVRDEALIGRGLRVQPRGSVGQIGDYWKYPFL